MAIDFNKLRRTISMKKSRWERLEEINKNALNRDTKCKYCKKSVVFIAKNIVKQSDGKEKIAWDCMNPCGVDKHYATCLGSPDYEPKFKKGDVILSKWKNHQTMYIIDAVNDDDSYTLIYYNKRRNRNTIPIKVVDKKSRICDEEMANAIFG